MRIFIIKVAEDKLRDVSTFSLVDSRTLELIKYEDEEVGIEISNHFIEPFREVVRKFNEAPDSEREPEPVERRNL